MGIKDRAKTLVKPFFNVRYWVSYDEHQSTWQQLRTHIKTLLFPPAEPTHKETFEQAIRRLQLSERGLVTRAKQCFRFALGFFVAGILSSLYTGYLLYQQQFAASFLGLGVTALIFMNAFRYHFWYFQIKNRKLGCSVKEWWDARIKG